MKRFFVLFGVVVLCVFVVVPNITFATAGDIQFTVKSELGYPISGAGISIICNGGVSTAVGQTGADGTLTIATSTLQVGGSPDYSAAVCGGAYGKSIMVTATSTGYIASSTMGTTVASNPYSITIDGVKYALKVISMKRESDAYSVMPGDSLYRPFSVSGNLTLASTTYSGSAWYLAASSTGSGGTLIATSSGYVNNSISLVTTPLLNASSSSQYTVAFDGGTSATYNSNTFKFGLKVIVADQFGTSVIPPHLNTTYRSNSTTTQGYSDGATLYWYNAEASGPLNIEVPGYLYATSTNTGFGSVTTASTSQVIITLGAYDATTTAITVSGTAKGLEPTIKITAAKVMNELGGALTPVTGSPFSVSGNLSLISQTYNSGYWYLVASSTHATTGGILTASVDGYVDTSVTDVLTSTTTQQTADWGNSDTSTYNGSGLPFALKVTAIKTSDDSVITGATVTAGNSYGTSCSESGSTGIFYCPIPLADTDRLAKVEKTGYLSNAQAYIDRTVATDTQRTLTISLSVISGGSSSGNSGSVVSSGYSAPKVISIITPFCPTGYTCTAITQSTTQIQPTPSVTAVSFTRRLIKGISGDDVRSMQVMLNSDVDTQIASNGPGSPGNETNFFGGLTLTAVQKFQVKYNIAKEGDAGYGTVGPMTRAMLRELYGVR